MTIVVGADHGGWKLAQQIVAALRKRGFDVESLLPAQQRLGDDYPLITRDLARTVNATPGSYGIGVCRTGVGVAMTANKISGIRAVAVQEVWQAKGARRDEDANILSLAADHLTLRRALQLIESFLRTPYAKTARYQRRLKEIQTLERRGR